MKSIIKTHPIPWRTIILEKTHYFETFMSVLWESLIQIHWYILISKLRKRSRVRYLHFECHPEYPETTNSCILANFTGMGTTQDSSSIISYSSSGHYSGQWKFFLNYKRRNFSSSIPFRWAIQILTPYDTSGIIAVTKKVPPGDRKYTEVAPCW